VLRVADLYSGSDTGRQRRHNEDSMFARAPLFVVADGMGGAQGGEVASRTAVEIFQQGLEDGDVPERRLAARVQEANAVIHERSQSDAQLAGMGTTLTAAYVGPEEIAIAHVGDSRAYCLRDGHLTRLTDDHSLVEDLVREGRLTREEAEDHPQRSIITRALGPEPAVDVDTSTQRARAGDVYLLCSDGLTGMLPEARVEQILRERPALRAAGEALLAAANEAGGRDNITVVLFRLEDVAEEEAHAGDQPTMIGQAVPSAAEIDAARRRATAPASATGPAPATAAGTSAAPGAVSEAADPPTVARRLPRRAAPPPPRRRRRVRRLVGPLIALGILAVVLIGAFVASQSVYFLGTDNRGFVTVFRGLPFDLPGNVHLYSTEFVSGVSATSLTPSRRHELLDHSLRSRNDAADLIRSVELGQVSG
jgi:protein phosphatase